MTGNNEPKIGAILLAAGGSSRLGRPKQLVEFEGKTLIRWAAESLCCRGPRVSKDLTLNPATKNNIELYALADARASAFAPIVVVLGAEIDGCTRELDGLDVSICINKDWSVGISSSIKYGLRHVVEIVPETEAVLIALCDQPYVTTEDYDCLATKFGEVRPSIIASVYDGVLGVPAIFAREIFDQLFALHSDQGARHLIRRAIGVVGVEIKGASFDIDTKYDVECLQK